MKVFLICITTACGRITPGKIGSPRDRRHLEDMRITTDASLLGAGTMMDSQDTEYEIKDLTPIR
ncbi:MAG: hypothetical protein U9Q89_05270 [Thermodesulfobacteriota bacterium]|nr:hypothetical protein [Thermodesulfobacteriota bacterium]